MFLAWQWKALACTVHKQALATTLSLRTENNRLCLVYLPQVNETPKHISPYECCYRFVSHIQIHDCSQIYIECEPSKRPNKKGRGLHRRKRYCLLLISACNLRASLVPHLHRMTTHDIAQSSSSNIGAHDHASYNLYDTSLVCVRTPTPYTIPPCTIL